MARIKGISANLNAFLDMLSYAEGTSTHSLTKNDGYDVIVTGINGEEIFTDYSDHPFRGRQPKQVNSVGLASTASGRYQFLFRDYDHYRKALGFYGFGPEAQDKWAIQLIRERKALPLIEAGKFREAVAAVRNLWASMPGAGYGQPEKTFSKLEAVYVMKGGSLWVSLNSSESQLPQSLPPSSVVVQSEIQKENPKNEAPNLLKMLKELFLLIGKLLKPKKK